MNRVEVIRASIDGVPLMPEALVRRRWEFDLSVNWASSTLVVSRYCEESRTSVRARWRPTLEYDRVRGRSSDPLPPIPVDVLVEVRSVLVAWVASLTVAL